MDDFIVVGGGIYGALVSWQLAKAGASTVLLEAKTVASGASGGLGKRGVRANGRDIRELRLMQEAYTDWPLLDETLGASVGYERVGQLLMVERPADIPSAEARVWAQRRRGIPTHWLGAEETREKEPGASAVLGAIFCPDDGIADHTETTRAAATAARVSGADVKEGVAVTSVETIGGRATAVITSDERRISIGKKLILLANAAVPQMLLSQFRCVVPVWNILPQVMLTQALPQASIRHLVGHAHRVLSIKRVAQEIMISGGWRGTWNDALGRGETTPDQVNGNLAEAVAVFPELAEATIAQATADRYESASVDGIPIIDQVPNAANVLFATGWTGHGWALAPPIARHIVSWALNDQKPEALAPFTLDRFH